MKTEEISYDHDGTACKGYFAYDEKVEGKRPCVIIVHAWGGRDDFAMKKAERMVELGYSGFALDMYGGAKVGKDKDENGKLMTPFVSDRVLLRGRIGAALSAVKGLPRVDVSRLAAIGFCFGGLCVLDLARDGGDVRGVVSFHGILSAAEGLANKKITAKVLVLHGYDDPMAKPEQLKDFCTEMTQAKADWQAHAYGGTLHAFTNPAANDPGFGTVYSKTADERSWDSMTAFFKEILA